MGDGSTATQTFSAAALDAFLNADSDGLVTFILTQNTGGPNNGHQWATKEHTTIAAPTLEFDVVPEPSTTALLGLGGFALIFRRRK